MNSVPIAIVAAVAENRVIGRDNTLIWRLKSDLRRFREITWGKPLIMGRKTYESIGKPLPGRQIVILTRDPGFSVDGAHVSYGWNEAKELSRELAQRNGASEVSVAGGAEIYRMALPEAEWLRLTIVHASPPGDVVFPAYDPRDYEEISRERHPAAAGDEHAFTFVDLRRRRP